MQLRDDSAEDFSETTDFEMLDKLVSVSKLQLLDIGCGAGRLSRELAARGAQVTGIEPDPIQAAKNREAEPVAGLTFTEGRAQELSAADNSIDGVFFKYSLHHVPLADMDWALGEAMRVLKPEHGFLYVIEPVMAGSYSELSRLFHDETDIRISAYQALTRNVAPRFAKHREIHYYDWAEYADFEAFLEQKLGLTYNDHKRAAVDTPAVRALFETGCHGDGYRFKHSLRVNYYTGLHDH
jgi:ubiquinone/menaquinone biosynthesis C-methylase UbiE